MQLEAEYPTAQASGLSQGNGLAFPVPFDAGYPATFPATVPFGADLRALFPTYMPKVEGMVYDAIVEACNTRTLFPPDGGGLALPATFDLKADVSLFAGLDGTYPAPVDHAPIAPIPVARGWPAYPGTVPAIGVAEATSPESGGERLAQGGFAGDAFAVDSFGNVIATCAYYAEPMTVSVVVELIHTNRDERDRLHDQLYRVLLPLRNRIPANSSQIRDVKISSEKQELPIDEQPIVMYLSLFTVEVEAEALVATEIVPHGVIDAIYTTATPYPGTSSDFTVVGVDLT